jgi:hypothetical protein
MQYVDENTIGVYVILGSMNVSGYGFIFSLTSILRHLYWPL